MRNANHLRGSNRQQGVKQENRVCTARHRNNYGIAGAKHVITGNRLPDSIHAISIMTHEILERARSIRMLLMDVDGVLTDGRLLNIVGPDHFVAETKAFDSQDGIALQWLSWYNIATGVISGRVSPATEARARQVSMKYVYQGHIEKIPILEEIIAESGISAEHIAYMGDDLTDVVVMKRIGLAVAPANARPEVKRSAHYTTQASGGAGAVRELCELILQAQGYWPELLRKYEVS